MKGIKAVRPEVRLSKIYTVLSNLQKEVDLLSSDCSALRSVWSWSFWLVAFSRSDLSRDASSFACCLASAAFCPDDSADAS